MSPPIIIFIPSSVALLITSFTHLIFKTFSSPLMPSQFMYMLPKSQLYRLACAPIFIKQISSLSQIILWHSISLFIKSLPHQSYLSSNPYLYQSIFVFIRHNSTYSFPLQRLTNHAPAVKTTLVQGCMPAMGHCSVQR